MKICEYGGIKEIIHMGGGNQHGFPFGFSTGCIHYQRDYKDNNIKLTRNYNSQHTAPNLYEISQ